MNENHVIDSWIAELGLSSRRVRRGEDRALTEARTAIEPGRPGREAPSVLPARPLRRRYQVISSPC
ncbi:MAG TPA: hypothetical protein VG186_17055 [Solirubrobacteraceae bacterium]|jgi:hypothetical protein|nr:hypothetical protein [Solirubrobacteraceae bacterium]